MYSLSSVRTVYLQILLLVGVFYVVTLTQYTRMSFSNCVALSVCSCQVTVL